MRLAEPTWPTDAFWLTAHDGIKASRLLSDRLLGIGLATGLLAELVHGDWCQLWDDALFRTAAASPADDAALSAVLARMEEDEEHWPPSPSSPAPVPPATPRVYVGVHVRPQSGEFWPPSASKTRPAGRGHQLGQWMAYLANGRRAEMLVADRLAGKRLARCERHGLVVRTVRYVPCDTVVAGYPASMIRTAAERGLAMSWSEKFLAGLYLATGLSQYALATLSTDQHTTLLNLIKGLDDTSKALLKAADDAVANKTTAR